MAGGAADPARRPRDRRDPSGARAYFILLPALLIHSLAMADLSNVPVARLMAVIVREADAAPIFKAVFAKEPIWAELLERLPPAGLFPNDPALIKRIQALRGNR